MKAIGSMEEITMFRSNKNWMMVALLAIPAAGLVQAQQYPPYQQQQYPSQQQQYPAYGQPQANFSPEQLDQLVSRIALYPDPLLAQIFAAATFPDQIQDAAQWADQHHYLSPQNLARAIQSDNSGFDPSLQALLPFPSVLQVMAADMTWTSSLGNAFLSQGPMLQDSVQRMRRQAYDNGYLRNNDQIVVNNNGPWLEIQPYNPAYITVPYYDPAVVYYRPWRSGGHSAISFGYGVSIGSFFDPWGWGGSRFVWDRHETYINNRVWDRRFSDERHVTNYRPYAGYERRSEGRYEEQRGRANNDRQRERYESRQQAPSPVYRPEVERRGQAPEYRPEQGRAGGSATTPRAEAPAYRPDQGRAGGSATTPRAEAPAYRPDQGRVGGTVPTPRAEAPAYRPEQGRGPAVSTPNPTPRSEGHILQDRNNNERRAADQGRPAPRETHGNREERRRN